MSPCVWAAGRMRRTPNGDEAPAGWRRWPRKCSLKPPADCAGIWMAMWCMWRWSPAAKSSKNPRRQRRDPVHRGDQRHLAGGLLADHWLRALAPARRIEAAIRALEDDSQPLTLPRLPCASSNRIAQTLNTLSAKLHAARQRQRQLSRRLLAGAREQEQAELARELHDELGQSLEAIGAMLPLICCATVPASWSTRQRQCVRDHPARNPAHSPPYPRSCSSELRPHGLDGLVAGRGAGRAHPAMAGAPPEVQLTPTGKPLPPLPARHACSYTAPCRSA